MEEQQLTTAHHQLAATAPPYTSAASVIVTALFELHQQQQQQQKQLLQQQQQITSPATENDSSGATECPVSCVSVISPTRVFIIGTVCAVVLVALLVTVWFLSVFYKDLVASCRAFLMCITCTQPPPTTQTHYVKKMHVLYWDDSEKDNASCPTCKSILHHPAHAIIRAPHLDGHKVKVMDYDLHSRLPHTGPHHDDTCVTSCGHCYHFQCLNLSLRRSSMCPVCRSAVDITGCCVVQEKTTVLAEKTTKVENEKEVGIRREQKQTEMVVTVL